MKPSEILDAAANIVLRDGWHQGTYFAVEPEDPQDVQDEKNRTAPCCQAGAISRAAYGMAWVTYPRTTDIDLQRLGAHAKAGHYMGQYIRRVHGATPIEWNDRPERTAGEVVAALRGAADDAREADE